MIGKDNLDNQQPHWENTFTENQELFGSEPSESARQALERFKQEGVTSIVELGAGQGRDTLFFAQQGLHVYALEYTASGVQTITDKAEQFGLSHRITVIHHDVRSPLPFDDALFDACYSHMLFCMAFTTEELETLSAEIRRVLQPKGLTIYTVRNTDDKHYRAGIARGEDLYEINGFIVHFFSLEKIEHLAAGYQIVDVSRLQEGELPRELFMVTLSKRD